MRVALCALAVLAASFSATAALAQVSGFAAQPNTVLHIQRTHVLDGVWRVGALGDLTLTTRPGELLEGRLRGRPCHGQYRGNTFALLCESNERGPYLISGSAREEPPVATTARARLVARRARMWGQIHQSHLSNDGYLQEIAPLSATRQ